MASEHEIRFSRERQVIQLRLHEVIDTAMLALDLDNITARSVNLISHDGIMRPDTIAGQQVVMSWTFHAQSGKRNKIEIAIGASGDDWTPVITFTDDHDTVELVVSDSRDWPELSKIRELIVESIKRTK